MELKLLLKYFTGASPEDYQGIYILWFKTKLFQFRWFTDYGEWFLYIHLGKRYWRFSSAGYIKG